MIFGRGRESVADLCDRFADATLRQDGRAAATAFKKLAKVAETAPPGDLDAGLPRLMAVLRQVPFGNGAEVAVAVSGLIEYGADPVPVLHDLAGLVATGLENAARFPELGIGTPDAPRSAAEAQALLARAQQANPGTDIGPVVQAWFTVNDWIPALLVPLQQKRARLALTGEPRRRLTEATTAMVDHARDATWLLGLLLVLDDAVIAVEHRPSGTAYDVVISGIGDNFQLHTLLADLLIGGGHVPGEASDPAWVAAATTGEDLQPATPIRGQFEMADADGERVWNEGRPADIPVAGGRRVLVLSEPTYARTWNLGRAYPLMVPEITLRLP